MIVFRIDQDPIWNQAGSREFAEKYLQHEILAVAEMAKCAAEIFAMSKSLKTRKAKLGVLDPIRQPMEFHELVDAFRTEIADISKRVDDVHISRLRGSDPSELSGL